MKKISAISVAAFYLLLTTGLYVCILHCTADYFLGTHQNIAASQSTGNKHGDGESDHHQEKSDHHGKKSEKDDKECGGDANCSCCNQHGQYAIKENIQTSAKIHLAVATLTLGQTSILTNANPSTEILDMTWPHGNAPPFSPKKPIYISNRSLLI